MAFLNASIPIWKLWVRSEFLYNLESHHGEYVRCAVFGVKSIRGRALGFHIVTDEGAQFFSLPLHALVTKQGAPQLPLDHLQLWDCFDYDFAVTEFAFLSGLRCAALLKDRSWYTGKYLFTIDWCHASTEYADTAWSEEPSEHKCAHLIALDNGCIAAQPNNRIQWYEPSFIVKPFRSTGRRPDYKVNTHEWHCETSGSRWATEDSDRAFYEAEAQPEPDSQPDSQSGLKPWPKREEQERE